MASKILIALIWLVCFSVLLSLFQAHGVGAFVILLIAYLIIKNNQKKNKN